MLVANARSGYASIVRPGGAMRTAHHPAAREKGRVPTEDRLQLVGADAIEQLRIDVREHVRPQPKPVSATTVASSGVHESARKSPVANAGEIL